MKRPAKTSLTAALLCLAVSVAGIPPASAAVAEKPFLVYISPSAQPWNTYADGVGNEEMYMRKIAVAMVPYLQQYGINYIVAGPQDGHSFSQSNFLRARIREAENRGCDLYLSIHSNAANGQARGARFYLHGQDQGGNTFTQLLARNYPYPDTSNIRRVNNNSFLELNTPTMPRALIETAFHDNTQDMVWIQNNIDVIARDLAESVYQFSQQRDVPARAGIGSTRISARLSPGGSFQWLIDSVPTGIVYSASDVRFTTSNAAVATVNAGGRVTARARGTAVIRASVDGYTTSCTVTVQ